MSEFKVGDRVQIVNNRWYSDRKLSKRVLGKLGTVISIDGRGSKTIKWDHRNGDAGYHDCFLQKVDALKFWDHHG